MLAVDDGIVINETIFMNFIYILLPSADFKFVAANRVKSPKMPVFFSAI